MRYLLIKGQCEDVGRIIHQLLGELCIRLPSFQVISRYLKGPISTRLKRRNQIMNPIGKQGKRTAAVKYMSNFSSLFRASLFHALSEDLMDSSPQTCHSDPKGGTSSRSSPLLTLERTYESQEIRTSSNNPCVRDVASDLKFPRRYACLALKIICITCWLQGWMVLEGMSTLSSMSVMFITKWMS